MLEGPKHCCLRPKQKVSQPMGHSLCQLCCERGTRWMGCRNSQTRSDQEALCFEEPAIVSAWTAKNPIRWAQKSAALGLELHFSASSLPVMDNHGLLGVLVAGDGSKAAFWCYSFGSDARRRHGFDSRTGIQGNLRHG